jgi:hypothetical protein
MSLLSCVTLADTYQAEAGIAFENTDADGSDTETYSASTAFYFRPIDDSRGPRMEAAFLSRASGVSANFSDGPLRDKAYELSTRFTFSSNFIIEASYLDFADGDEGYRIGTGTYVSDHSDVVLSYTSLDNSGTDILQATYHSVLRQAGQSSLGYAVSAGYIDTPVGDGYLLDGDLTYYFNPNLGIGGSASFADQGAFDSSSFGVHANYFIHPTFFIEGYVETTDYDGPNEDSVGIGASIRF